MQLRYYWLKMHEEGHLLSKQHPDKSFGPQFIDALREDRKDLYSADLLRSGFLIAVPSTQ